MPEHKNEKSTSDHATQAAKARLRAPETGQAQPKYTTDEIVKMKKHCPICERFMVRPVAMKRCGHYFCLECLNEVSEYAMKDGILKKLRAPDGTIRCPLCREVGFSS